MLVVTRQFMVRHNLMFGLLIFSILSPFVVGNSFVGIFNGALSSSAQIKDEISGSFTAASASFSTRVTANETKLDGIEASADVTDASNVTSAGALMDSEVASLDLIKTITAADISGSITEFSASVATRLTNEEADSDFTAAGISGSFTDASASFSTRVTTNETKLATIIVAALESGSAL